MKLTDDQLLVWEGELTLEECKHALDSMASGKSPGLDGLPAEFFQCFWSLMGADYVEVLNYCYVVGKLSLTQRSGVITLLHKKGDRLEMKNWRPITLLCVDYKIAVKAIANRLLTVLSLVIHPDQSCGVPGRNPNESSRLLKDIVCDANQNGVGAAVLSLDQEKAFDRIEWSYLLCVLQQMNFGDSFRQWITLFYSHIFSFIQINGELTEQFKVMCGVRQGCPLPPLLYVIMAETIACAIFVQIHKLMGTLFLVLDVPRYVSMLRTPLLLFCLMHPWKWNNHPLLTQSNYSPRQLWFLGMIEGNSSPSCAVQDALIGQNEIESCGADDSEGYTVEEEQQRVVVPASPYELTEQQNERIGNVRQTLLDDTNGTQTYFAIREYLRNTLPSQ